MDNSDTRSHIKVVFVVICAPAYKHTNIPARHPFKRVKFYNEKQKQKQNKNKTKVLLYTSEAR